MTNPIVLDRAVRRRWYAKPIRHLSVQDHNPVGCAKCREAKRLILAEYALISQGPDARNWDELTAAMQSVADDLHVLV